jgi:hypothetical protein
VVIGSAVLSMRGVGFARHVDEPDVLERREHRRTRPDDDVVAPVTDGEPVSVALPLVAAEVQADPVTEGRSERCGRRGDGRRLGDHHDRAPPAGETRTDGVDGGGLLVFGRRSQDERPRSSADRFEQVGPAPIVRERGRNRRLPLRGPFGSRLLEVDLLARDPGR